MSAVSNRFTPASRQISTSRVASATSLAPQARKNSLPPPKVPVPKLSTGTLNPDRPRSRYSMIDRSYNDSGGFCSGSHCDFIYILVTEISLTASKVFAHRELGLTNNETSTADHALSCLPTPLLQPLGSESFRPRHS